MLAAEGARWIPERERDVMRGPVGQTEDEHPAGVLPRLVDVPLEHVLVGPRVVLETARTLGVRGLTRVRRRRAATSIRRGRRVAVLEDVEPVVAAEAEPQEHRPEIGLVDVGEVLETLEAVEGEVIIDGGDVDRGLVRIGQPGRGRHPDCDRPGRRRGKTHGGEGDRLTRRLEGAVVVEVPAVGQRLAVRLRSGRADDDAPANGHVVWSAGIDRRRLGWLGRCRLRLEGGHVTGRHLVGRVIRVLIGHVLGGDREGARLVIGEAGAGLSVNVTGPPLTAAV